MAQQGAVTILHARMLTTSYTDGRCATIVFTAAQQLARVFRLINIGACPFHMCMQPATGTLDFNWNAVLATGAASNVFRLVSASGQTSGSTSAWLNCRTI